VPRTPIRAPNATGAVNARFERPDPRVIRAGATDSNPPGKPAVDYPNLDRPSVARAGAGYSRRGPTPRSRR